jgi:hypothetical protein
MVESGEAEPVEEYFARRVRRPELPRLDADELAALDALLARAGA